MSGSELDPQVGAAAESQAEQARRDARNALSEGGLTLSGLFEMSGQESEEQGSRPIGHMHLRSALLALPWIGEKKADEILAECALEPARHIATIGTHQQDQLRSAVRGKLPAGADYDL